MFTTVLVLARVASVAQVALGAVIPTVDALDMRDGLEARSVGGNAIVKNNCGYDVWLWSVDQKSSTPALPLPAHTTHTEPLRTLGLSGVSLKISKTAALAAGTHTQFEYAIRSNLLYYDISFVDCAKGSSAANCPGWDGGVSVKPKSNGKVGGKGGNGGHCGGFECKPGAYCPEQAYFVDRPVQKLGLEEPVLACGGGGGEGGGKWIDLVYTLCSG